jgi:uncharacterized protein YcbK (DUF882 family)
MNLLISLENKKFINQSIDEIKGNNMSEKTIIGTKNFTETELLRSNYAEENNISEQYNPTEDVRKRLQNLAENFLQPLRDGFGEAIIINSCYRCQKVNNGIKGSSSSYHMTGEAVDVQTKNDLHNKELWDYISNNMMFDNLIWYYMKDSNPKWIHVTFLYDNENNRKNRIYKTTNGNYIKYTS